MTDGCLDKNMLKAVWDKNEKDIKLLVESRPKMQDRYSDDKNERDYITKNQSKLAKLPIKPKNNLNKRLKQKNRIKPT